MRLSCLLLLAVSCFARVPFSGNCQIGGATVVTSTQNGAPTVQGTLPGATLTPLITGGAAGTVNTSGTAVTWVNGTLFNPNGQWNGLAIVINSVSYTVSSASSTTALTLTATAGTQTAQAYSVANAPAAIYSDNAGTPIAGAITCGSPTGSFLFYADGGSYQLRLSGTGVSSPFVMATVAGVDPAINAATVTQTQSGTSGTAACSMTLMGTIKTASCYLNGYANTGAAQTYVYPLAFSTTPVLLESGGSCGTYNPTTTASTLTLPANAAMTAETCNIITTGQ